MRAARAAACAHSARALPALSSAELPAHRACAHTAARRPQIVETEHLTKALLEQSDSLVKRILEKARIAHRVSSTFAPLARRTAVPSAPARCIAMC